MCVGGGGDVWMGFNACVESLHGVRELGPQGVGITLH